MGAIQAIDRRTRTLLGVCLLALALPAGALAQQPLAPRRLTVRGVLRDSISGLAIPRGQVSLADTALFTIADAQGRFELRGVPEGPRVLRVQALGYLEIVVPVTVSEGLGPLEVRLEPKPIPIAGLDVNAGGPPTVWGVVVDAESGVGIPFGSVWLRNGNRTGVADARGSFRLTRVPEGDDLLLVSKLGYIPQYIQVRAEPASDPVSARLEPDSVVLKGLRGVTAQMKTRRNAYPSLVREYTQERIVRSASGDIGTFLTTWTPLKVVPCERSVAWVECTMGRSGRPTAIVVFVDDLRIPGGLSVLKTYPPHEIYSVELFGKSVIRAYTNAFMEQAARRPRLMIDETTLPGGTRSFGGG